MHFDDEEAAIKSQQFDLERADVVEKEP